MKREGVAARTSSFAFRESLDDIREIGRLLNVRTVLEGSVRTAGDRIRLTAQLINVEDGYHIWSKVFDESLSDVFAIQDEIAASIAESLVATISEQEKETIRAVPRTHIDAYDYYLRGRRFF